MGVHCRACSEVSINVTSAEKSWNLFLLFFSLLHNVEKTQNSDVMTEIMVFPHGLFTFIYWSIVSNDDFPHANI